MIPECFAMKFCLLFCLLCLSLFLMCGCQSLPDGTPPEHLTGDPAATSRKTTWSQAENTMSASLLMRLTMLSPRNPTVRVSPESGPHAPSRRFLETLSRSGLLRLTGDSEKSVFLLESSQNTADRSWTLSLLDRNRKVLWTRTISGIDP